MEAFLANESIWFVIRWMNAFLSSAVVALLLADYIAHLETMSLREFRSKPWIIATYAVIAYASGEIASSSPDIPPGWRVIALFLTLTGTCLALVSTLGADRSRRKT